MKRKEGSVRVDFTCQNSRIGFDLRDTNRARPRLEREREREREDRKEIERVCVSWCVCVLKSGHGSAPVSGILNRRERERERIEKEQKERELLFKSAAVRRAARRGKTEKEERRDRSGESRWMERRRGGGEEVEVSALRWWSQVTHRSSRAAEREDGKYGFQPPSSAAWLDLINFSGDDDGGDDEAAVGGLKCHQKNTWYYFQHLTIQSKY